MSAVANPSQTLHKPTQTKSKYRPEIDGLRAFAVVAVIINHFNKDLLPSGYLGVDIFFVISGYVITSSLADRKSKNFWDFVTGFYERRIKRLVPALVVFVLITSVLICLFNPDPGNALGLGWKSLFGLSNISLYRSSTDYFAQSTELNPFTHTWSLGVEEQFYLLFPFLIWFSGFGQQTAKGARNLFFWVGVMTIASLLGFIYLYQVNQPAAYFLMPPRFWEMAAGCLLFIGFQKRARIEQTLEQVPPLLVVAAITAVMFRPIGGRGGTIAIVLLSAVLIACLKKGTVAYKFFTLEKVVYIGLISYSLYLWHWTVLSISRWTIGIHWWSVPIQVGLMLLLAFGSYNWIEKPIRNLRNPNRKSVFGVGIVAILTSAPTIRLLGSDKNMYIGERSSMETDLRKIEARYAPINNCKDYEVSLRFDICTPVTGQKRRTVAIVGDSFSTHMLPAMKRFSLDYQVNIIYKKMRWGIWYPFPPPPGTIIGKNGVSSDDMSDAVSSTRLAVDQLLDKLGRNDAIIFSTYLPTYFAEQFADKDFQFYRKNNTSISRAQALENWSDGIAALAKRGNLKGIDIVLISPMPQFLKLSPVGKECVKQWFNISNPCSKGVTRKELEQGSKAIYAALERLETEHPNVFVVDPMDSFCSETKCLPYQDSDIYFIDAVHMSGKGAMHFYSNRFKDFMVSKWLRKTLVSAQR
jgi:peptidoglycan/LPS O-acetylase OafA/YrhL